MNLPAVLFSAIKPQLLKHFPNNRLSLEVSNEIKWTNETKLDDIFAHYIEEALQLDFNDISEILDKLEEEGIISKK